MTVLSPPRLFRPTGLAEAAQQASDPDAELVAGGCELALSRRRGGSTPAVLVMLDRISGLDQVQAHPKIGLTIGASVRMSAIAYNLWVAKRWAALHEAIEHMLPPQIRNMATVAGNICAAVPGYDIATALTALRASVAVVSPTGETASIPVMDVYDANGQLALPHGAVVSQIRVGPPSPDSGSAFRKIHIARRHPGDSTTINVASYVALDPAGAAIVEATLAIGGCTQSPVTITGAEQWLRGAAPNTGSFEQAGVIAADNLSSRENGNSIQRDLVRVLVRDVLEQATSRARSKHNPFDDAQQLL
jgi:aerobic carbon-monoxide dehydrogenase medium subunit